MGALPRQIPSFQVPALLAEVYSVELEVKNQPLRRSKAERQLQDAVFSTELGAKIPPQRRSKLVLLLLEAVSLTESPRTAMVILFDTSQLRRRRIPNQVHPIYSSMLAAHSVILSITPLVYLPIRLGSLIALLDLGLRQTLKKALRHLQSASQRPHLLRRAILQTSLADPPQLLYPASSVARTLSLRRPTSLAAQAVQRDRPQPMLSLVSEHPASPHPFSPLLLALQTPREQLRQASQLMRTVELTEIQMLRSMSKST